MLRRAETALYEWKRVEVLASGAARAEAAMGVAPYYLCPQPSAAPGHALHAALAQAAARGWEFCQIEETSVRQRGVAPGLPLYQNEATEVVYTLSFRRAKRK